MTPRTIISTMATVALAVAVASAQPAIDWYTIDAGGDYSTGGAFELEGTIGQPDAGSPAAPMTGPGAPGFELVGGFWPVTQVCYCPGDLNHDGRRDGLDIQQMIYCVLAGGDCSCADVDAVNGVTPEDVEAFVSELLAGTLCP
jgi:hypothetical protein